jgi:predicted Rossmann fold flavoprotein
MSKSDMFDLIVVGGGAAGFFGAINTASLNADLKILILEKSNRLLTKVRVSGGGRCNVTHHCFEPTPLSRHYPRGQKQLKKMFREYQATDVVDWFQTRGVKLKTEDDGRMFPVSDSSETIIDCFFSEASRLKIRIEKQAEVVDVVSQFDGFYLVKTLNQKEYRTKKLLITTGGSPKFSSYEWLAKLGHQIVSPIPSLFTFNDRDKRFKDLMGVSVSQGKIQIAGTSFKEAGPILITHWGLSGPAVIKLSAWAAAYLHEHNYTFTALVNWIGDVSEEELRSSLLNQIQAHPKKTIMKDSQFGLPVRLWVRLCELAEINETKIWSELSKKSINKLMENLIRCPSQIQGKTTFKEEFVTCGGVSLEDVNLDTMESKRKSGIYLAGEVLNIDGETGGFNFQSAWTTSYIAASAIGKHVNKKTSETEV